MNNSIIRNFPYKPLGATEGTVRLLRIHREKDGSIAGTLEHFSLDSTDCPKYMTLSYCWGKKTYPHVITLNGHRVPILRSLYPMLEVICNDSRLSSSWWWIDSVCINQNDDIEANKERSLQVQLMGQIYEASKTTVGWLGKGPEDSAVADGAEDAIDFLHLLAENRGKLASVNQREVVLELSDREKWSTVEKLLLRPWWRRVWTLQEYLIPPKFIFYCGTKSISRSRFKVAIYSIYLCRQIDNTLITPRAFQPAWNRRRLYMWQTKGYVMRLVGLMAYASDCKATDPKDRIYSLLGLAKDARLGDPPDYNSNVEVAYSKFVKSFVELYNNLDVICFADRFNRYAVDSTVQSKLPSWVPDWRAEVESFVIPLMASQSAGFCIGNFRPVDRKEVFASAYAAAGEIENPQITISDDLRLLTCKGIFVDSVDGAGGLQVLLGDWAIKSEEWDCIDSTSPINRPRELSAKGSLHREEPNPDQSSNLMEDIMRCLVLNQRDRYLSDPRIPKHFYEDFQTFCLAAIDKPENVDRHFRDWFQRSKSLHIQGHSFEELCKAAKTTHHPTLVDDPPTSDSDCFHSRFTDTTEGMARRLITTYDGNLGMAPGRVEKGDKICVLLACNIPVILRKREDEPSYEVIGECYLHGFMNGEIFKKLASGKFHVEEIQLS